MLRRFSSFLSVASEDPSARLDALRAASDRDSWRTGNLTHRAQKHGGFNLVNMSEKRESAFSISAKIGVWNCLIEPASIAGLFVRRARRSSRTAGFSLRRRRRRKRVFVLACVAGRRRLPIWPHGAEARTQFPAHWPLSAKAPSTAMAQASKHWQNDSAWANASSADYSFSILEPRPSPWHKLGAYSLPSNSFMKRECP